MCVIEHGLFLHALNCMPLARRVRRGGGYIHVLMESTLTLLCFSMINESCGQENSTFPSLSLSINRTSDGSVTGEVDVIE